MPEWLSALGREGHDPRLLFIDSADEVLLRRYADTRRRHPLSHLGLALADAISLERQAPVSYTHLDVYKRQVVGRQAQVLRRGQRAGGGP